MSNRMLVAGIMSGTSLDGIDAVLLDVGGSGASIRFRQLAFISVPYPSNLRAMLRRNSSPATSRVDEIARLNVLLAELYADAVRRVARRAGRSLADISLIGSHGQTIQHLPGERSMFGRHVRATLQIGDPSALAALTGVCTVGDFRMADVALGGQGAPLVPYVDWLRFRSKTRNRLLLNIGGIGNITALPCNCRPDDVIAFDTGPGNMVVDGLMERLFRRKFDDGGQTAVRGQVIPGLFRYMARHPFLGKAPPKSTGREDFGRTYVDRLLAKAGRCAREDVIRTASQFTAHAVREGYRRFVEPRMKADELIVSGGGARNMFFVTALRGYFPGVRVLTAEDIGMSSQAKEAICFAILAHEALAGHATNLPAVTGARRRVILGKICPGRRT